MNPTRYEILLELLTNIYAVAKFDIQCFILLCCLEQLAVCDYNFLLEFCNIIISKKCIETPVVTKKVLNSGHEN